MRTKIARLGVAFSIFLSVLVGITSAADAATCGGVYWPTNGSVQTTANWPGSDDYVATFTFTLMQSQRDALQCLGEYLELDFDLRGFSVPAQWDNYVIRSTNLPGAIHDIAYGDPPDTANAALTRIYTSQLAAGVEYHATISWNASKQTNVATPVIFFKWSPSHWSTQTDFDARQWVTEAGACINGNTGFLLFTNAAWCVFPNPGQEKIFDTQNIFPGFPGGLLPLEGFRWYEWHDNSNANGTATVPTALPASAQDGAIVESDEGNYYVYAGKRLFWFDRNDSTQVAAFRNQAQARTGSAVSIKLHSSAVHAIEVNRTATGAYSPGTNMPVEGTFLYQYGSGTQYVIKFQRPFAIGSPDEVVALGGQNKAVMVPVSIADLQTRPAQWVRDDLLQFWGDPTVWHHVDRGYRVPGVPVRDCLMLRFNRGVTLMPASAWAYFPTHATQQSACEFGHGQWLYGSPSNRQIMVLYGVGFYVQYGEVAGLGGTNQARGVTDLTVDTLINKQLVLPEHHLFRAVNSPHVYMNAGGQFHYVGSPSTRNCLQVQYGVGVEVVPQSFIDRLPQGAGAQCAYEGKQMLSPGGSVDYVRDGARHHVQNTAIRDCLIGRAGTLAPVAVDDATWNSYPPGPDAYCPYETELGLNFIRENGNPTVWLVRAPTTPGQPGTKQHVGSLCVTDPYTTVLKKFRVWIVPPGETAGHIQTSDFWADGSICGALPG